MPPWPVLQLDLQASTSTALVASATATQTSLALQLPQMMKYGPSLAARQVDTFQQLCWLSFISNNIIDLSMFKYTSKCVLLVPLRHALIAPAGNCIHYYECICRSLTFYTRLLIQLFISNSQCYRSTYSSPARQTLAGKLYVLNPCYAILQKEKLK